jgi:hypothetical protein
MSSSNNELHRVDNGVMVLLCDITMDELSQQQAYASTKASPFPVTAIICYATNPRNARSHQMNCMEALE